MYVILLQETHFPSSYNPKFIHPTFPNFFLANAEYKIKGVAIIFSHNSYSNLSTRIHRAGFFWSKGR